MSQVWTSDLPQRVRSCSGPKWAGALGCCIAPRRSWLCSEDLVTQRALLELGQALLSLPDGGKTSTEELSYQKAMPRTCPDLVGLSAADLWNTGQAPVLRWMRLGPWLGRAVPRDSGGLHSGAEPFWSYENQNEGVGGCQ
ncbi:PREDICTED: uncharacterized protein LOC102029492 isoform X1 [Chinchilla lanigera]|uniref:uncharacterized protein LOC102029492 isoform X1 n=1 Tax=Chinchilla lanigera TaxID=34839 RepID=UPI0006981284|nr:PREDICTED: uncharacterized protein LOC102029492 isoform X1 [Chinchilla lanigera]